MYDIIQKLFNVALKGSIDVCNAKQYMSRY